MLAISISFPHRHAALSDSRALTNAQTMTLNHHLLKLIWRALLQCTSQFLANSSSATIRE